MIALLTGRVFEQGEDWVIIDCGSSDASVGYLVFCSSKTLAHLPLAPNIARLHIETHVREDHIHLYGFMSQHEKQFFKLLTGITGVGAKVALALLSAFTPEALTLAIAAEDKTAISRAKGVGGKLAQRLIVELKDKLGAQALYAGATTKQKPASKSSNAQQASSTDSPAAEDSLIADVVSALTNLGYQPSQSLSACALAHKELGENADFDSLFRNALTRIAG